MVENVEVKLSNLTKVFWPKYGYTKGDMIDYYITIYPYIKDFLQDRPLSLKIYPDGINGDFFFQKNMPDHAPDWLSTVPIYSRHRKESINWVLINKLSDLLWIINRASIELHCWFSTINQLERPNFAVFDLDPGDHSGFVELKEVALLIKELLNELKLKSYLKTSGQSGLHIYIPVKNIYNYRQIKKFLKAVAELVVKVKPELATIEWRKNKREGRVYIDYRQNGRAKTLPSPYSLRPTKNASISTPLAWGELHSKIKPADFNLSNITQRLAHKGDLWSDFLKTKQELPYILIN